MKVLRRAFLQSVPFSLWLAGAISPAARAQAAPLRLQLNWFHDPTFAAAYQLANSAPDLVSIQEGGPNVPPLGRLRGGLAQVAIVGIDIFLRAVGEDLEAGRATPFRILGVDFQRSAVGYVLHPEVGDRLGLNTSSWAGTSGLSRNEWLFARLKEGRLRVGDKVGTETTAIWLAWRRLRAPELQAPAVSVGFDPQLLLQRPELAYPVYLNEEPFKLKSRVGREFYAFDPTDDGINVYGNVLVTSEAALQQAPDRVRNAARSYFAAWGSVAQDGRAAVDLVRRYYRDVPAEVLLQQIEKTLEFVTHGGARPGQLEAGAGGRLEQSIEIFRAARAINNRVTLTEVTRLKIDL